MQKLFAIFRVDPHSYYFPAKEWDEARRTLPEDVFRQEYMAEFLEDSAGVFRGIEGCLVGEDPADNGGRGNKSGIGPVVVGCDIAKHTDWTVLIAMEARTGRCLAMERFNRLDWPVRAGPGVRGRVYVWNGTAWELSRNRVPVPEGMYIWDAGDPAPGGKQGEKQP